jgi:hypothetical protein
MNYSKLYFNKEIEQITYQDIEDFFSDEKEESDKREFKSYYNHEERNDTEKENAILKTICGLLNSEGGIVIWGSPIGQVVSGKKEKIFKGTLSPSDKRIEKDSFINKITDSITPSPKGIRFQSLNKEGKYVYIIEVDPSAYSPHQFKNIYYMRIDGQTKPAPHHYIEALFRKITFPKLEGYIKIESIRTDGQRYIMEISSMIFNKSKLQNEDEVYYRIIVSVGVFQNYELYNGDDRIYTMQGHEVRNYNAKSTLYYNEPVRNTEIVLVSPNELMNKNYEVQLFFYFGGKKSPLMFSKYVLSVKNIYESNLNNLFVSINENLYAHENDGDNGMSDKDKLKTILGR